MNPDIGSSHHPDTNRAPEQEGAKIAERAFYWTTKDLFLHWLKWPVLVTLALVAGILPVTYSLYQAEKSEQAAALEAAGNDLANRLNTHIDRHLHALTMLVRQIEAKDVGQKDNSTDAALRLDEAEFMRLALPIRQTTNDFLAINFIDRNHVIRWMTPLQPIAGTPGISAAQIEPSMALLEMASQTGKPVAAPPVNMSRRETIIATYFPVYSASNLIGFIHGVFRGPDFEARTLFRGQSIQALSFVVQDEDRIIHETHPGVRPPEAIHPAKASVRLLNRNWQVVSFPSDSGLVGSPRLGWIRALAGSGILAALAAGFALAWMALQRARFRHEQVRFADFASVTSDWFWEQDDHLRFTFISSGAEKFIGMPASNLYGRSRAAVAAHDVNEPEMQSHIADLEARRPFHDFRYIRYDDQGKKRVLSISGRPVFDNNGVFTGYRGVGREITHEVEIEGALKLSEEKYRQIFYSSPAVKIVFDASNGAIIDANDAACAFYGYRRESFIGLTVFDINTLPEADVRRAMSSAATGQLTRLTFRHRLASGTERDVEVFPGALMVDGRPCIYSIIQDITMRRRLEADLSREIAFRQSLFEALPLPVFVRDTQSRFTDVNPAFESFYGRSAAELYGQTPHFITTPELAETYIDSDRELLADPGSRAYETRGISRSGRNHHVIIHKATFGLDPKKPDGIVGVIVDETERREAEANLVDANARLALTAEYAHLGAWDWDVRTGDMVLSEQSYRILGYEPGQITLPLVTFESFLLDFVHEEDRQPFRQKLIDHFKGLTERFDLLLRIRHRQGHWVSVFSAGKISQLDQSGRAKRMVGVVIETKGE